MGACQVLLKPKTRLHAVHRSSCTVLFKIARWRNHCCLLVPFVLGDGDLNSKNKGMFADHLALVRCCNVYNGCRPQRMRNANSTVHPLHTRASRMHRRQSHIPAPRAVFHWTKVSDLIRMSLTAQTATSPTSNILHFPGVSTLLQTWSTPQLNTDIKKMVIPARDSNAPKPSPAPSMLYYRA